MEYTDELERLFREAIRKNDMEEIERISKESSQGWRLWLSWMTRVIFTSLDEGHFQGMEKARAVAIRHLGVTPNPFGTRDAKVQAPATYRPVGPTCPADCEMLDTVCYAQQGYVRIHQGRAGEDEKRSAVSTAIAAGFAIKFDTVCRLHVSGDFGRPDGDTVVVDERYIEAVCFIVEAACERYKRELGEAQVFTYTHFGGEVFDSYRARLKASGIVVLYSGRMEPGGAIVVDEFDSLPMLRELYPERKLVKCLYQLSNKWPCSRCKLCPRAVDDELTIVFEMHGRVGKEAQKLKEKLDNGYL